jgi:hypothetical protein
VFTPFAKLTLGPTEGAVNVTRMPVIGFPETSRTVAERGSPNGVVAPAVCGVPPVAAIAGLVDDPTMAVAVASGIKGGAPAWIIAVPGLTPETATTTVVILLPSG